MQLDGEAELPVGTVQVWSGAIVDIPDGWVLCDGNNGTPDLRNRFIVGAGDTYSVEDTGGSINHQHAFTGDGHIHEIFLGEAIAGATDHHNYTDPSSATGDTDNANGLPPYFAKAYIMYTG